MPISEDVPRNKHQAIAQGLNKYFTGDSCINGHIDFRYTRNSSCVECHKASNKRTQLSKKSLMNKSTKKIVVKKPYKVKIINKTFSQKTIRKKLSEEEKIASKRARYHLSRLRTQPKTGKPYHYGYEISENFLGYTYQDLYSHLSSQRSGFGEYRNKDRWHIDHIIPVAELVRLGVRDPAVINHLDNLQLLTVKQNLSKSDSIRNKSQEEIYKFIKLIEDRQVKKIDWAESIADSITSKFIDSRHRVVFERRQLTNSVAWFYNKGINLPINEDAKSWVIFSKKIRDNSFCFSSIELNIYKRLAILLIPENQKLSRIGFSENYKYQGTKDEIKKIKNMLGGNPLTHNIFLLRQQLQQAITIRRSKGLIWKILN